MPQGCLPVGHPASKTDGTVRALESESARGNHHYHMGAENTALLSL